MQLTARHGELADTIALAHVFAQLMCQQQSHNLIPGEHGRRKVLSCPYDDLYKRCATTMTRSKPASHCWSNAPDEGYLDRLKLLKCQMFGRASLDLSQRSFLLAV
jgi:transposase